MTAPELSGQALAAVRHRGSHLQIIAAAGSGKTEVVSQRVASLLADGVVPEGIVAFTFTERAAAEMRGRIAQRVEQLLGREALDTLGGLFVGTIHAYCFRLLQTYVPRYETFDVLDENQLAALLTREANRLGIKRLHPKNRLFAAIQSFLGSLDVVENELIEPASLDGDFGEVTREYLATLERYRLLTYGQQVATAVRELEIPAVRAQVLSGLRHLIVDEYQDVNPAQERLIELLAGPGVELCVVGDDDQAIYQWRGSDVRNIVTFAKRYSGVATFEIVTNRRSLPRIIDTANRFATSIPGRLPKVMNTFREPGRAKPQVALWNAPTEAEEAEHIATMIDELHENRGVAYHDIAVLVRSSVAYSQILEALAEHEIPVQPGGRMRLFQQPEGEILGRTCCWLVDVDWRSGWSKPEAVDDEGLVDEYVDVFDLTGDQRKHLRKLLRQWKTDIVDENRVANLVGEAYALFEALGVRSWDPDDPFDLNRLGTLARFTSLLADYESVRLRARPDPNAPGEQVGGDGRGPWYYRNLATFVLNHAQGAYDGFDGEAEFVHTGVDVTTIHRAKGLEWPVVFVPSLTKGRFPGSMVGRERDWLLPRDRFDAERYEGSDDDERRLFYVAVTRARDLLLVSRHERVSKNRVRSSPYYDELADLEVDPGALRFGPVGASGAAPDETVQITFSELASFLDCGLAFRFRNLIGFQPRMAPELGYGKAVHHLLRAISEHTREHGRIPSSAELDQFLESSFFLPLANKPAHKQMKEAARRLVTTYADNHADDLQRIWETERPFELHLDGVIVTGRADVILDREDGKPDRLAILDYKTSTGDDKSTYEFQLQVYADAGRREGLDVVGAYVHDLDGQARHGVDVTPDAIVAAEERVVDAAQRLKERDFSPNPGKRCRTCDVRSVCGAAKR